MMKAPGFDVELADWCTTVIDHHNEQASEVKVACLISMPQGTTAPVDMRESDEDYARTLKSFLDAGFRTICVEGMQGVAGQPTVPGSATLSVLQNPAIRLVGVDSLADASEMRQIQLRGVELKDQHLALFSAIRSLFQVAVDRTANPALAAFVRLAHRKSDSASPSEEFLAFEERFGMTIPADARRVLVAFRGMERLNVVQNESEYNELVRRARRHVDLCLLHPDFGSRFRVKGDPKTSGVPAHVNVNTPAGMVTLTDADVETIRMFSDFLKGIPGEPTAEQEEMLSKFDPEMREQLRDAFKRLVMISPDEETNTTGQDRVREGQRGFNHISDMVISRLNVLGRLLDITRVLGIDLDAYPSVRRDYEFSMLLSGTSGEGFFDKLLAVQEKVLTRFEKGCAHTSIAKELLACWRFMGLLENLAALEITPDEYSELVDGLEDYRLAHILEILARANAVDPKVVAAAAAFDLVSDQLLRFYELARARAQQMADWTVDEAHKHCGKAVLLCLGFHMPTIKNTWAGRKVSYLITLPALTGRPSMTNIER